jgi:glycosyltransferase involved in cell wall biosynthesis
MAGRATKLYQKGSWRSSRRYMTQEKHPLMKNQGEDEGIKIAERRRKIAFVYYKNFAPFIKNDYAILANHYGAERVKIESLKDMPRLASAIIRCDISFTWFAGEHAFPSVILSRILGKRSIVVAGGYDVAWEPEISYGQFGMGWSKRTLSRLALNNADAVLAVSEFTKGEVLKRAGPRDLRVIYNTVDLKELYPVGEKEDLVLTVAQFSPNIVRLKGLDSFVKAAACLPEVRFEVIGSHLEDLVSDLPSDPPENVYFPGFLSQEELVEHYRRAKVYCQLSYRESFGMALAEAMACECVPVVTERGALPEVVGDTGFYVPYGDAEKTSEGIKRALSSELGKAARERIRRLFTLEKRESELVRLIESL